MTSTIDNVLAVQHQLTVRDWRLLGWLYDHRVLTSFQIAHALFPSLNYAQRRLTALTGLRLVERFRPFRLAGGSHPYHYALAHTGALIIAASRSVTPPRRGDSTARLHRIATSRNLDHRLGINQFFTDLAGHERTHPSARLHHWWPDTRLTSFTPPGTFTVATIHADGLGVWTEHNRTVAFYLEHDTGTEFSGGRGPCRSPDLRVSAAQRLMARRYRQPQVWCKHSGGVSPVRAGDAVEASVAVGHRVGGAGRAGHGSSVPANCSWLRDAVVLSPVRCGQAVEPAVFRVRCPCRCPARGRCVRRCRDRHPNRPPRQPWAAAQGRFADQTELPRKTFRGLSYGGGIHA